MHIVNDGNVRNANNLRTKEPNTIKKLLLYSEPKENLLIQFWTHQESTEGNSKALSEKEKISKHK